MKTKLRFSLTGERFLVGLVARSGRFEKKSAWIKYNYTIVHGYASVSTTFYRGYKGVEGGMGLFFSNPRIDEAHFLQFLTVIDVAAIDNDTTIHHLLDDIP